jgi:outer membrane protein
VLDIVRRVTARRAPLAAVCLLLAAAPALGQTSAPEAAQGPATGAAPRPARPAWEFFLGGGILLAPEYEGSDEFALRPVPFVGIRYRDLASLDLREGLGVTAIRNGRYRLGASLSWDFGRDGEGDIEGLDDIDGGLVGGLVAGLRLAGPFELTARFAQGLTGDIDGFRLTAGLEASGRLAPRTFWSLGPGVTWASHNYTVTFFGVTPAESARSGLAAYRPGSGLKDASLGASLRHAFGPHWSLINFARLGYLVGDAADSPIVRDRGDRLQPSVGLMLAYSF